MIFAFEGKTPRVAASAFIAPTAVLIGDVVIEDDASVFYGAVLRGDVGAIRVGARSNIQDNAVVHVDRDADCHIGSDVTVGHKALVHGATIGDGTLVGMSSSVLSHAVVGEGSLIAAGAVVLEGQEIPARSLAAGVPAKVRRELSDEQSSSFIPHAGRYVELSKLHTELGPPLTLEDVQF